MSTTATLQESPSAEQCERNASASGKTFVWHQVFGASTGPAVDFYTRALGWGTCEYPMEGGNVYHMLTVDGLPIAGVVGTQEMSCAQDCPPHWSVSIGVDDVDARTAKCVELGAKLLNGPFDIPGVGRTAVLEDPNGASFWLFTPKG